MLVQHLRHPLERIDVRPGFWGLEWSCPSPWEVPEGMIFPDPCCEWIFTSELWAFLESPLVPWNVVSQGAHGNTANTPQFPR